MVASLKVVRNAERAALAEAIARAREAERAERDARAAADRAADAVDRAKAAHDAALAALEAAQQANVDRFVRGDAGISNPALREARIAEMEAADDLAAAKAARQQLAQAVFAPEAAHLRARRDVEDAARKVIVEQVPRVLREAIAAEEAFIAKLGELRALEREIADQLRGDAKLSDSVQALLSPYRPWHMPHDGSLIARVLRRIEDHPAGDRWRAARAALEANADAPLPAPH